MFKKKFFIGSLSLMFALSGIGAVQAEGDQGSKSTASKVVELDPNGNAFLTDLTDDGYAELGRYKVEKIKDNIYHCSCYLTDRGIEGTSCCLQQLFK